MSVNIPSHVDDLNYRYKMPAIRSKIEGTGNGIKTNMMNMKDVASSLKRNPEYVVKYLACELSTHGRFFNDEGKAIFRGVHSSEEMAAKLDGFIEAYVLCPMCKLPEIDLVIVSKLIHGKCNACGGDNPVNNIHRVAAYIQKNPPEGSTVGGKKTKEEKRAARVTKAVDEAPAEDGAKVKKKVKKVVRRKKAGHASEENVFDIASITANTIMLRLREHFTCGTCTPQTFFQEIRTIQLTQDFDIETRFYLALGSVFGCGVEVDEDVEWTGQFNRVSIENMKDTLPVLCCLGFDNPKECISALEKFMSNLVTEASYRSHYPLIMKAFYDESIVDDDDVLEYYSKKSTDERFLNANKCLQPLLTWMANAAGDSDSYEEESSDAASPSTKKLGA